MDTSETYIKMCDCEEIQGKWKPQGGDWYLHDYRGTTGLGEKGEKEIWRDGKPIWEKIEVLAYKPSEKLDTMVSTDGEESHLTSIKDLFKHHTVWLPRQDQLQEMVNTKYEFDWELAEVFASKAFHLLKGNPSMEQLWLAFVMKEKYQKTWDGTTWVPVS